MNQIKSDFEDISFDSFNKSDSLFEDPNDTDSLTLTKQIMIQSIST